MRFSIAMCVATLAVAAMGQPALAKPTAAQKCASAKMQATGKFSLCRMQAEAKAEKTGKPVDFSKCATKHTQAFQKIEEKGGVDCPTTGDAISTQIAVAIDTSVLVCRLKLVADPGPPAAGAIVVVPNIVVTDTSDPVLTVNNLTANPITAYCFMAAASPCQTFDFFIPLPASSSVSWLATAGVPGQIPPVQTVPFSGEMVCLQVDAPVDPPTPSFGNNLSASVLPPGGCRQDAILIPKGDSNNGDTTLTLGGAGNEYGACPASIGDARIESCWTLSAFTFQCN